MKFLICALIGIYQKTVGRILSRSCRFYPSCSEYARQAYERFGFLGGTVRTVGRLLRCHPLCPGGYDPVGK